MAEALVSSILEQLVAITIENARQQLKLVIDVEQEMEKLQSNFKAIWCVLENAEEKQMVDKSARLWLEKLKEVSYDMEDVLDEWKTAILKSEMDGAEEVNVRRKVCSCFSCFASCRQVVRHHDIASKIKQINEDLDVIAEQKDRYQLATSSEIKQPRRRESTSFIDVSKLHGRDEVKNEIVKTLLGGNEIHTISIVGMGGIGKTALAQLIFNDPEVKENFNHVIWVCVSDFFDQYKIAREILGGFNQVLTNPVSLQEVLTNICDKIKSSKFLLVLDDVWTDHDEDWQPLKVVFRQGMPGSRVLLTTRKKSIARAMGSSDPVFHLEELSDEICWLILKQVAFVEKNNHLHGDLEDVGWEIAKKCKGSPLVAKILGGLLREKNTRKDWQNILNSEIWKLDDVVKNGIFTPLLLSYYDLPSEIRPCLLYCAIFPKDFAIFPDQLIKHWMSHGYLNMEENSEMEEEKGKEYFNYLASRYFFQDFEKDGHNKISRCKMHDLIHDFVQDLTKNEVVQVEVKSSENLKSSKKTRHLRAMIAEIDQFPRIINGMEKLRSLVVISQMWYGTSEALQALFKAGKCLRVLDFALDWRSSQCEGLRVKEIPNEIRKLIHLRYLNLHGSGNLKELPEVVCELYNLQHLNVSHCGHLKKLPDGIRKLVKLRSLDTHGCESLVYYPKGIGRLSSLKELTFIIARIDGNNAKEFSIGDFENLDLLRGSFPIILVGNAIDLEETKRARMDKKIHLNRLVMLLRDIEASDDCGAFHQALSPPPSVECELITRNGIRIL